jgi:hypothetical protein
MSSSLKKGDAPIMQVKETCVSRDVFPFIMKANASHIMKADVSPFIIKACVYLILYIER